MCGGERPSCTWGKTVKTFGGFRLPFDGAPMDGALDDPTYVSMSSEPLSEPLSETKRTAE